MSLTLLILASIIRVTRHVAQVKVKYFIFSPSIVYILHIRKANAVLKHADLTIIVLAAVRHLGFMMTSYNTASGNLFSCSEH